MVGLNFLETVFAQSNDPSHSDTRNQRWPIFEPLTVAGQPAVVVSTTSDRFNCGVVVGTARTDSIWVTAIDGDRTVDSCPRAVTIAQRVIGNLGG